MLKKKDLIGIRNLCLSEYKKEIKDICFMILYGGAARCFIGEVSDYNDFDINIFFKKTSKIKSTYGKPKKINKSWKGKKIEVMRNKIKFGQNLKDFIKQQKSKRWIIIGTEAKVKLYPGKIKVVG